LDPSARARPVIAVYTIPPSGNVPYPVARDTVLAFESCRRETMLGMIASRAGVHSRDRHSIRKDIPKIHGSRGMSGSDA
jgi:hypothetical protein